LHVFKTGIAMLHLSPETEALLRANAQAKGKTPEQLLRGLLAAGESTGMPRRPDIEAMKAIAKRAARLPILDHRSEKEITDEGWGM
jgi:hypothetical protein